MRDTFLHAVQRVSLADCQLHEAQTLKCPATSIGPGTCSGSDEHRMGDAQTHVSSLGSCWHIFKHSFGVEVAHEPACCYYFIFHQLQCLQT